METLAFIYINVGIIFAIDLLQTRLSRLRFAYRKNLWLLSLRLCTASYYIPCCVTTTNSSSSSCINQQAAKNRRCVLGPMSMERNSWKVFPEGDLRVSESLLIEVYAGINTHVQPISNKPLTFTCANEFSAKEFVQIKKGK